MNRKLSLLVWCLLFTFSLYAQKDGRQEQLIQFSGVVLDGSNEQLQPIPYVNVLIKGDLRGTFTDFKGFFSVVARPGDNVEFSAVGYKTVLYNIPDTLQDSRYSIVQLMTQDTINLPETVVFPWPSREHFKLEFLAMDVTSDLQRRATENLTAETLERMRSTVPYDGNESADFYLRQQARSYYYTGQTPPMNIFNPMAWKEFFDAWKSGKYKKK
ncbi:MAG: carboxypeptidase-like regulatory domain-containing protein [Saprospiraceae bacterium]